VAGLRLSEADFQRQLLELAELYGWRAYHTLDSRGSHAGFPDLVLVRGRELVFAELKSETGRLRPEQAAWAAALEVVSLGVDELRQAAGVGADGSACVDFFVWRPRDFERAHARLARGRRAG
jgi:hypothetical protein